MCFERLIALVTSRKQRRGTSAQTVFGEAHVNAFATTRAAEIVMVLSEHTNHHRTVSKTAWHESCPGTRVLSRGIMAAGKHNPTHTPCLHLRRLSYDVLLLWDTRTEKRCKTYQTRRGIRTQIVFTCHDISNPESKLQKQHLCSVLSDICH